ncbi:MAG: hypothetical protein K9N62_00745 [Verrucomicrobia bacterium]|nr:hypothetical protein [Verrucomicrobiota bacterium]
MPASPGIALGDVYYALFRWKRMIGLLSLAGLMAAGIYFWRAPVIYLSDAKLLVRYVIDKSPVNLVADASKVKTPDPGGRNIINTELEILTSFDLAQAVAEAVGPSNILARVGGGTNLLAAAAVIRKGIVVEATRNSDAIRIAFQYPDPGVIVPVLGQWIKSYLDKQAEIRGAGSFDAFLVKELDQLRGNLKKTQEALRQAKEQAKVISLEDSTKAYAEQLSRIRAEILNTEAELAEHQASLNEMVKLMPEKAEALTNDVTMAAFTNGVTMSASAKFGEFRRVYGLLELLHQREQSLQVQFTSENLLLQSVRQQIVEKENVLHQIESENPEFAQLLMPKSAGDLESAKSAVEAEGIERFSRASQMNQMAALNLERTRVLALESKMGVLTNQLEAVWKKASALDDMEGATTDLQRREEMESARYKSFAASLEQTRLQQAMGEGQISNMSVIQAPSPPARVVSKLYMTVVGILFVSIGGALAMAFLIEFYLDRSLRRTVEIESRLSLSLVLSIPNSRPNGKSRSSMLIRKAARFTRGFFRTRARKPEPGGPDPVVQTEELPAAPLREGRGKRLLKRIKSPLSRLPRPFSTARTRIENLSEPALAVESEGAISESCEPLQPYYDALRDRLISYFDLNNMTHKPKLVAVTSCGTGCGVSSVAVGLATSLAEAADGRVLLVDMSSEHASAQRFCQGNGGCRLDEVLENGTRDGALVQSNLYVVTEEGDRKPSNGKYASRVHPRRFTQLVPRLKASDYDFIIFDMPSVSQTSVTPKVARFMDMVLFVVESEKTDGDIARRATAWLGESRASIGVILNKERAYVPEWLQQRF